MRKSHQDKISCLVLSDSQIFLLQTLGPKPFSNMQILSKLVKFFIKENIEQPMDEIGQEEKQEEHGDNTSNELMKMTKSELIGHFSDLLDDRQKFIIDQNKQLNELNQELKKHKRKQVIHEQNKKQYINKIDQIEQKLQHQILENQIYQKEIATYIERDQNNLAFINIKGQDPEQVQKSEQEVLNSKENEFDPQSLISPELIRQNESLKKELNDLINSHKNDKKLNATLEKLLSRIHVRDEQIKDEVKLLTKLTTKFKIIKKKYENEVTKQKLEQDKFNYDRKRKDLKIQELSEKLSRAQKVTSKIKDIRQIDQSTSDYINVHKLEFKKYQKKAKLFDEFFGQPAKKQIASLQDQQFQNDITEQDRLKSQKQDTNIDNQQNSFQEVSNESDNSKVNISVQQQEKSNENTKNIQNNQRSLTTHHKIDNQDQKKNSDYDKNKSQSSLSMHQKKAFYQEFMEQIKDDFQKQNLSQQSKVSNQSPKNDFKSPLGIGVKEIYSEQKFGQMLKEKGISSNLQNNMIKQLDQFIHNIIDQHLIEPQQKKEVVQTKFEPQKAQFQKRFNIMRPRNKQELIKSLQKKSLVKKMNQTVSQDQKEEQGITKTFFQFQKLNDNSKEKTEQSKPGKQYKGYILPQLFQH